MPKSDPLTLLELQAKIHANELEMASLRAALDVQFTRITQMQAELDVLPHARERRKTVRMLLARRPSSNGDNGRGHE